MTIKHFSPYDVVADEYYDPVAHPTCANFRELSNIYLDELRSNANFEKIFKFGKILETGAGCSLVAETLSKEGLFDQDLTIQDASEKMLSNSLRWQNSIQAMYASDARQMPERASSFDLTFSFLADPYNDEGLWAEIDRVLRRQGLWVVTVPSHLWASSFRSKSNQKTSSFVLRDGSKADLPSTTYPVSTFIKHVERQGLRLRKYTSLTTRHITGATSPKLCVKNADSSVLDCYLFEKSLED